MLKTDTVKISEELTAMLNSYLVKNNIDYKFISITLERIDVNLFSDKRKSDLNIINEISLSQSICTNTKTYFKFTSKPLKHL